MRGREDIFLSPTETEKLSLFRRILNARVAQTPVANRLAMERAHKPPVTDVNLRQIATLTGRNYGSVYNTYNGLVAELQQMLHTKSTDPTRLFAVSTSELRQYLVKNGDPFKFLQAVLYDRYHSFDDFLQESQVSKATMLRHLKPLRDFARRFGIRFSYESFGIRGDERRVRVFLTLIYWLAMDGAAWPFIHCDRDAVGALADHAVSLFDVGRPNLVMREIAMYYLAIAARRVTTGNGIAFSEDGFSLKYPVPNLFEDLPSGEQNPWLFAGVPVSIQMGESASLYFLFNFLPFYVTKGDDLQGKIIQRFQRYNPAVYTLVSEFLAKLPVNFLVASSLPAPMLNLLRADLFGVTLSILEFGDDLSSPIGFAINERLHQMPADEDLRKKVRQTLEHVIFSGKLAIFEPHIDGLTASFYDNVVQLAIQFMPPVRVKVAVVIEQPLLGYVDLLSFLSSQPLVEFVSPIDADLDQADLVIESATVPDAAEKKGEHPATYKWAASSPNDWFGGLYATIRQLWDEKMKIGGQDDY